MMEFKFNIWPPYEFRGENKVRIESECLKSTTEQTDEPNDSNFCILIITWVVKFKSNFLGGYELKIGVDYKFVIQIYTNGLRFINT